MQRAVKMASISPHRLFSCNILIDSSFFLSFLFPEHVKHDFCDGTNNSDDNACGTEFR